MKKIIVIIVCLFVLNGCSTLQVNKSNEIPIQMVVFHKVDRFLDGGTVAINYTVVYESSHRSSFIFEKQTLMLSSPHTLRTSEVMPNRLYMIEGENRRIIPVDSEEERSLIKVLHFGLVQKDIIDAFHKYNYMQLNLRRGVSSDEYDFWRNNQFASYKEVSEAINEILLNLNE